MGSPNRDGRVVLVFVSTLVLLALVCNEFVLVYFFSPDGELSAGSRWRVRIIQATLLIAALSMAYWGRPFGQRMAAIAQRHPNGIALAFGLGTVAALLVGVELVFHAWNTIAERRAPDVVVTYSEPLWKPGVVSRSRKAVGDRVIYDVRYTMGARGTRVTPASLNREADSHVLFFGGSYTFGQGVRDAQTLPNVVAERLTDRNVMNFGYPGQGPTRMLERLDAGDVLEPFRDDQVVLVFTFIPNHVRRVIGSMRVSTTWGRDVAYYAMGADGTVERRGSLSSGRPVLARVYGWLGREPILKHFEIDLPARIAPRHLEHTAAVIGAARDRFLDAIEDGRFYVVVYPDRPEDEFSGSRIVPHLESRGIAVFDYSGRLEGTEKNWFKDDTHPTAAAHAQVGGWLAEDLRKAELATRLAGGPS
jgi:hypothetical protein